MGSYCTHKDEQKDLIVVDEHSKPEIRPEDKTNIEDIQKSQDNYEAAAIDKIPVNSPLEEDKKKEEKKEETSSLAPIDEEAEFLKLISNLTPINTYSKKKLAEMEPLTFETKAKNEAIKFVKLDMSVKKELYYGFVDKESNTREYKGVIMYSDGSIFEGHFTAGKFNGKGRLISVVSGVYEGDYVDGIRQGNGKAININGDSYEGDWINDKPEGFGVQILSTGERYEGDFLKGERHGNGKLFKPNEGNYDGDFVNGLPEGKGKMEYKNRKMYQGDWKEGKETGAGKIVYPDGSVYDGEMKDSMKEGKGQYSWTNGEIYVGPWSNNHQEGKGILATPKKGAYYTVWKKGILERTLEKVPSEIENEIRKNSGGSIFYDVLAVPATVVEVLRSNEGSIIPKPDEKVSLKLDESSKQTSIIEKKDGSATPVVNSKMEDIKVESHI